MTRKHRHNRLRAFMQPPVYVVLPASDQPRDRVDAILYAAALDHKIDDGRCRIVVPQPGQVRIVRKEKVNGPIPA